MHKDPSLGLKQHSLFISFLIIWSHCAETAIPQVYTNNTCFFRACLSVYLSVYVSIYVAVNLCVYLCVCQSTYVSVKSAVASAAPVCSSPQTVTQTPGTDHAAAPLPSSGRLTVSERCEGQAGSVMH